MNKLRFAIVGTGFWARYQLAGWQELSGAECVALCNRHRERAADLARAFGVPAVYDDPQEMLRRERLDFLDIITDVTTHAPLVHLAAAHRLPVICQKPMATTLAEATAMVRACREAQTPFYVHENWRWQTPLRQLQHELSRGVIGQPFRARIHFCSSFPVFDNQPFLKELEQFILTDIGSHILDVARFLFGEATTLYCQTHRIHKEIKGEDVATVMMTMGGGLTVVCEMSYASRTEHERFPETYVHIEGEKGSLELGPDYRLCVTTEAGSCIKRYPPPHFSWVDPAYELVQASIVPCNANLLAALRGEAQAETTGEDNLKTVQLIFASYESARSGKVIYFSAEDP
ncbi:MAG TPA: Gfo/Idh/MocA family oxidoreductase [Blastocatellia bacterium]|nr:Gfo/Idh/MocA family oxidoreductase [Blastocatellia bacterium]